MSVSVYTILMEDFYYNTEKHSISDVFNKPILLDQDFGSIWDAVLNFSTPGYLSIWKNLTIIVTLGWGKGVSGVCVCVCFR